MLVEVIRGEGREKPLSLDATEDEEGCFLKGGLERERGGGERGESC